MISMAAIVLKSPEERENLAEIVQIRYKNSKMGCAVRIATDIRMTLASNVAALAVPAVAGDGVAVPASWVVAPVGGKIRKCILGVIGTPIGARTLTDVQIYGYDGTDWWALGQINGGSDVVTEATTGRNFEVLDVSIYQRIAVSADSVVGGNVNVYLTPVVEADATVV